MSERKRPTLGAAREDSPEVELWERIYVLNAVTRSVQRKLEEVQAQIEAAEESDAAVAAIAAGLDAMLAPANGQRIAAGKLVLDKWNADLLGIDELAVFFSDIQELTARPT